MKYLQLSHSVAHSVDRIQLEKLQINSNLHQTTNNDSNIIHKNMSNTVNARYAIEKEPSAENFIGNGFVLYIFKKKKKKLQVHSYFVSFHNCKL